VVHGYTTAFSVSAIMLLLAAAAAAALIQASRHDVVEPEPVSEPAVPVGATV
jgi:hypothetical protein